MALLVALAGVPPAWSAEEDTDAPDIPDDTAHANAAKDAADSAKQAAKVANRVATHSVAITEHAQSALKKARNAIHDARVDSTGLDHSQRDSLKDAEAELRAATQKAEYGKLQAQRDLGTETAGASDARLQDRLDSLQSELESKDASGSDVARMRAELRALHDQLNAKRRLREELAAKKRLGAQVGVHGTSARRSAEMERLERELQDIENEMRQVEAAEAAGTAPASSVRSRDELKAEMERLREAIARVEVREEETYTTQETSGGHSAGERARGRGRLQHRMSTRGTGVTAKQRGHLDAIFERLDGDHDGRVSESEFESEGQDAERLHEAFGRADTNHDHGLTHEEFDAAGVEVLDAVFDKFDSDHDGSVTRDEFASGGRSVGQLRAAFDKLDTNHDGIVSRREFEAGAPVASSQGAYERLDGNHDGKLSRLEFESGGRDPAELTAEFDQLDDNHDGVISEREFVSTTSGYRGGSYDTGRGYEPDFDDTTYKASRGGYGGGHKVLDEGSDGVQEKGFDVDTEMPYGELEPFGREDTAQELTEASIRESDEMVDQLERAEVAEEKRSVFRALTRLRGAAITSYDGVARAQTGNIDEYNKVHKWRKTHPLHHLADEESDISKWAFPDNADF